MTTRPIMIGSWASGGEVMDPDLDTTHLTYRPNYYQNGHTALDRPDHAWTNFLLNQSDEKLTYWYSEHPQYQPGLTFRAGMHVQGSDTKIYRSVVESTTVDPIGLVDWEEVPRELLTYAGLLSAELVMRKAITDHGADQTNPHNMTASDVGVYSAQEIRGLFDSTHPTRTDNPHGLDALDVGSVLASGGVFAGSVRQVKYILPNGGTLEGNGELKRDGSGYVIGDQPTVHGKVLAHSGNFETMKQIAGDDFTLPAPNYHLPLANSLGWEDCTYTSSLQVGYQDASGKVQWTIEDEASFTSAGLIITPDSTLTLTSAVLAPNMYYTALVDGIQKSGLADFVAEPNIIKVVGAYSSLRDLKIWRSLTTKQLTAIGV